MKMYFCSMRTEQKNVKLIVAVRNFANAHKISYTLM